MAKALLNTVARMFSAAQGKYIVDTAWLPRVIPATEMVVLWKTHSKGGHRVNALGDELDLAPSTISGMLNRLVDSGLLARARDSDDRCAVVMKGTEKLGELMRGLRHASTRSLGRALHGLPLNTRQRLVWDLKAVLECFKQEETGK